MKLRTRSRHRPPHAGIALALLFIWVGGCALVPPHPPSSGIAVPQDPARQDPLPAGDAAASMAEISFPSHGARLNGLIYLAAGAGAHPIVILLHGYPGNERNLDLAQAVRRAGYDVLYFDYRGSWGSGGTFSYSHALEDVGVALSWVRSPENAAKYHFDPSRLTLVGHSFGGWLALMAAANEPADVCVAAFAAENAGWEGIRFPDHAEQSIEVLDYLRATTGDGAPIHAAPEDILDEMIRQGAAWNYLNKANLLKDHPLLLVAATRDTPEEGVAMHQQLADAIHDAGGKRVRNLIYDDDHPFSSHRIALAETLTRWLQSDCAKQPSRRSRD